MPTYEWRGDGVFLDHANGREVESGETVKLDSRIADPNPGFVKVDEPEPDETGEEDSSDESEEQESSPNYSEMDYSELRQLAADAETDEINGKSSKEEILNHFED